MTVTHTQQVALSKANITLFWKANQLVLLDMSDTNDHKVKAVYALRKLNSDNTYTSFKIAVWVEVDDSNTKQLWMGLVESIPEAYTSTSLTLNGDDYGLWLDKGEPGTSQNDHVVVGTGDIRGIATNKGTVIRFKLNDDSDDAVIFTCTANYQLTAYHKSAAKTLFDIDDSLVQN